MMTANGSSAQGACDNARRQVGRQQLQNNAVGLVLVSPLIYSTRILAQATSCNTTRR